MSEARHTPGPWRADTRISPMIWAKTSAGDMRIADVRGWGHLTGGGALRLPEDQAKTIQDANAYLIAAAPELLEAIKGLLALSEKQFRMLEEAAGFGVATLEPKGVRFDDFKYVQRSKAAIAKAEGRP